MKCFEFSCSYIGPNWIHSYKTGDGNGQINASSMVCARTKWYAVIILPLNLHKRFSQQATYWPNWVLPMFSACQCNWRIFTYYIFPSHLYFLVVYSIFLLFILNIDVNLCVDDFFCNGSMSRALCFCFILFSILMGIHLTLCLFVPIWAFGFITSGDVRQFESYVTA